MKGVVVSKGSFYRHRIFMSNNKVDFDEATVQEGCGRGLFNERAQEKLLTILKEGNLIVLNSKGGEKALIKSRHPLCCE
jgi:hypothetical protein